MPKRLHCEKFELRGFGEKNMEFLSPLFPSIIPNSLDENPPRDWDFPLNIGIFGRRKFILRRTYE